MWGQNGPCGPHVGKPHERVENIGPGCVFHKAKAIFGLNGPHGHVGLYRPHYKPWAHYHCLTARIAQVARDDCGPIVGSVSRPQFDEMTVFPL